MDYRSKKQTRGIIGLLVVLALILGLVLLLERTARPKSVNTTTRKESIHVQQLAKGIMATHGQHWWVTRAKAEQWAGEVVEVTQLKDHSWIQPVDLLAIAAGESDFRTWRRCEGGRSDPNGYDCGITQVRATIWNGGKTRAARAMCDDLVKSSQLGFLYAAKELTSYRKRYFKKLIGRWWSLRRALFNAYKSGPSFCKMGNCGRYWLRVHCFRHGLRLARRPRLNGKRVSCRQARSLKWIWKVYR